MNHEAVCRTAPATPGLSNISLGKNVVERYGKHLILGFTLGCSSSQPELLKAEFVRSHGCAIFFSRIRAIFFTFECKTGKISIFYDFSQFDQILRNFTCFMAF